MAQVLDPIVGIGRLGVADPRSAEVRQEGDLRGLEANGPAALAERLEHGIHHGGVKCMGRVQPAALDATPRESRLHLGHRVRRTRDGAEGWRVDRREGSLTIQEGHDVAFWKGHRQHRPGGKGLDEAPPGRHQETLRT